MKSSTAIQRLGMILAVIGALNPFASALPFRGEMITNAITTKLAVTGLYSCSVLSLAEFVFLVVLCVFCFIKKPIVTLSLSVIQTVLMTINWIQTSFYLVNSEFYFCIFFVIKVIGSWIVLVTAIIELVESIRFNSETPEDGFSVSRTTAILTEISICLFGIWIFLPSWNQFKWIPFSFRYLNDVLPAKTYYEYSWILGVFLVTFAVSFISLFLKDYRWRFRSIVLILAELLAYFAVLIFQISRHTASLDYGFVVMVGTIITCIVTISEYVSYTVNALSKAGTAKQ